MDLDKFFEQDNALDNIDFGAIEKKMEAQIATDTEEAAKLVGDGDCDGCKI